MQNRKIITVIGSSKFRNDIKDWAWQMTKICNLVLFAPFAKEVIDELEYHRKELELQHFQKIDMAGKIFVFNRNGYFGESMLKELNHAINKNKPIEYLEPANIKVDFTLAMHHFEECGIVSQCLVCKYIKEMIKKSGNLLIEDTGDES